MMDIAASIGGFIHQSAQVVEPVALTRNWSAQMLIVSEITHGQPFLFEMCGFGSAWRLPQTLISVEEFGGRVHSQPAIKHILFHPVYQVYYSILFITFKPN